MGICLSFKLQHFGVEITPLPTPRSPSLASCLLIDVTVGVALGASQAERSRINQTPLVVGGGYPARGQGIVYAVFAETNPVLRIQILAL